MTAGNQQGPATGDAVFQWHPDYRGKRLDDVTRELESNIAQDQRAYELALAGAEESEHDALASVVDLERQWSTYNFAWHEEDPSVLARRIAAFEWEREQRQDMMSWNEYRNTTHAQPVTTRASGDWRASMSDQQRRRIANLIAGILVALIAIVFIAVVAMVVM